jgi:hypothetical protein
MNERLATYLIRHADIEGVKFKEGASAAAEGPAHLLRREPEEHGLGRLGGGLPMAIEQWIVEGWLYIIFMAVAIGVVIGVVSLFAIKFSLRRKWIDSESLLLWPTAVGVSNNILSELEKRAADRIMLAFHHRCLRRTRNRRSPGLLRCG